MQSYKLVLSDHATNVLKRMAAREPQLYQRVVNALSDLEKDPFQGKLLKGELRGKYSYRVGDYRIIYRVHKHELLVLIIDVGHRRQVYQ
ncbi:MAG: type II toxin-antitoxin system RelE/ParE family toxin [Candidatus Omnitrophica bacterium]|nr:type II toxin-antitoxin system RelE/ParE family toxin [Candidatus Omnitrophota bacterium]